MMSIGLRLIGLAALFLAIGLMLGACQSTSSTDDAETPRKKVGVVCDTGGEQDRGFSEYTLKGARKAAEACHLDFDYAVSESANIFEQNIKSMIDNGASLVITVGFMMADVTAIAARRYPETRFVIVDYAYYPGSGCPDTVEDCYSATGGLNNVTSLVFAEDECGYLAGVLAGCMTRTGVVASVAGMEVPPVVRFITGFQNGARSVNPEVTLLNQYIPDFSDTNTGKVVGQQFINQGADVIFGAGGYTGNGGLLAAQEANCMAIGVDVDQYLSFPEVGSTLISSAMKRVDVAVERVVREFANQELTPGIRLGNLANGAVGLAPFHEWEDRVPEDCRHHLEQARQAILNDPQITGAK